MLDVKLLELDLAVVKNCTEHDQVGGAVVPAQSIKLCPNRSRATEWIARVSPKCEIAGAKRAAEAVGEPERFGRLRERNSGGRAGQVPNRMLSGPFVGNAGANFSTEDIEIELKIGAFVVEP